MSAKRFDIGRQYQGSIGAPAITEQHGGRYVLASDYDACVAHNEMLVARLKKQAMEMEAVGAGGVSLMGGNSALDGGGIDPRNSHIDQVVDGDEQPWM